ncbi:NAD(P)H-dependent oxidoreductase [Candidatus Magnetaquicoccus inordinatus]|uniref:NAD(P)H-dependent oxidoreductase n=1 Tax=Candidatus Magnetaquicoccus inordinatus TaxID=2496818 RepID=UPI001D0DD392|nr:NAD(P)H-dependent oxidoreductase [Candidatus Magnetaquicoccus inordinatus]
MMQKVLIINCHQPYPVSPGQLNASLVSRMQQQLQNSGYEVALTIVNEGYQIAKEVEKHLWADVIIIQTPVYWMGLPWIGKKYIDEIFSAGAAVGFFYSDGRSSQDPKRNYGMGGGMAPRRYMLSLTYNAPAEAFGNPEEPFMAGKGVDDMFLPLHLSFRFLGMQALPTFACHDVHKAPEIAADFARLEAHLRAHFPAV